MLWPGRSMRYLPEKQAADRPAPLQALPFLPQDGVGTLFRPHAIKPLRLSSSALRLFSFIDNLPIFSMRIRTEFYY